SITTGASRRTYSLRPSRSPSSSARCIRTGPTSSHKPSMRATSSGPGVPRMSSGAGRRLRSAASPARTSSGVSMSSSRLEPAKRLAPPAFRRRQLVEGVDVETGDLVPRVAELRRQALDQGTGPVAAAQEQAREQSAVATNEPRRLADSDSGGDPQELPARDGTGNPDVDGQADAALPDGADPPGDHTRVEAELADDVRRERLLVEHHLNRRLVADEG